MTDGTDDKHDAGLQPGNVVSILTAPRALRLSVQRRDLIQRQHDAMSSGAREPGRRSASPDQVRAPVGRMPGASVDKPRAKPGPAHGSPSGGRGALPPEGTPRGRSE